MKKISILLNVIGVSQIALGALFLFAPAAFVHWMGISSMDRDANYLLGMLSARFFAYGAGMFHAAKNPEGNVFWIRSMLAVQAIDFGVGAFYLGTGAISLSVCAFPMFNAAVFSTLLAKWSPKTSA